MNCQTTSQPRDFFIADTEDKETYREKPILHAGNRVPLARLKPDPFEHFVFGAINVIGTRKFGWDGFRKTSAGADGGFDASASTPDGKGVCIQCKRMELFSVPHLAHELAKVALQTEVEGSDVESYLVITSGKFRRILDDALRELDRETLREKAVEIAADPDRLEEPSEKAREDDVNLEECVAAFVRNVELHTWSGAQFDTYLGHYWQTDEIKGLVRRTFQVETFIEEHPRPQFQEHQYLQRVSTTCAGNPVADLYVKTGPLPDDVTTNPPGNPLANRDVNQEGMEQHIALEELPKHSAFGRVSMLVGRGGAGKTTALKKLLSVQAQLRIEN